MSKVFEIGKTYKLKKDLNEYDELLTYLSDTTKNSNLTYNQIQTLLEDNKLITIDSEGVSYVSLPKGLEVTLVEHEKPLTVFNYKGLQFYCNNTLNDYKNWEYKIEDILQ